MNAQYQEILNKIIEQASTADKDAHLRLFAELMKIHGGNEETCRLIDKATAVLNRRYAELA